jgi:hypothetical protein
MSIFRSRLCFGLISALCLSTGVLEANDITICKSSDSLGLQGVPFTFHVTDTKGTFSATVTVPVGQCSAPLLNVLTTGTSPFTITEAASATTALTNISVIGADSTSDLNARSVSIIVLESSIVTASFVNSPLPPGNQGCTPGYYKQTQHFAAWGSFTQTQKVSTVFTGAISSLASETLLDALQGGGGSGLAGAETILLRAGVAALLNASNSAVKYSLTPGQVTSAVDTALASGDRDTILLQGSRLDGFNNGQGGCPLN